MMISFRELFCREKVKNGGGNDLVPEDLDDTGVLLEVTDENGAIANRGMHDLNIICSVAFNHIGVGLFAFLQTARLLQLIFVIWQI